MTSPAKGQVVVQAQWSGSRAWAVLTLDERQGQQIPPWGPTATATLVPDTVPRDPPTWSAVSPALPSPHTLKGSWGGGGGGQEGTGGPASLLVALCGPRGVGAGSAHA